EVRSRFAGPGGGVEIGGKATRRLVRDQTMTVLVFCNRDVRCGEIQDHGCPGQSSARRRGNGHPEILTDLHKKGKLRLRNALKQKMLSERNLLLAQQINGTAARCRCRSEVPVFIELAVIGQERFRNDSENFSAKQNDRAIEQ